jgi:glutamyl-tRNA synthetase
MSFDNARFRFAPSPTGLLHIGGVRTALFNWLLARKHKGTFVLRIEDTDKERSTDASMSAILDGFRWLGIDWDEGPEKGGSYGPYFQSERTALYKQYIDKLLAEGKAYRCFCDKDALEAKRLEAEKNKTSYAYDRTCLGLSENDIRANLAGGKPFAVRLKVDPPGVSFTDLIRGPIDFANQSYDDFVIVRQDGWPVYNFAVTVDDASMKITHVIRGEEHISNTPRQLYIYRALGLEPPRFGHVPIILAVDGSKLSKRHGATSVQQFREQGYLPDALINFLARLGWSYDDTQEIFSRDELVEKFSLDKVSPSAGVFNPEKLLWINAEYMKKLSVSEKAVSSAGALVAAGLLTAEEAVRKRGTIEKAVELVGERMKLFPQIAELADFVFRAPETYDPKSFEKFVAGKGLRPALEAAVAALETLEPFDAAGVEHALKGIIERMGLNIGKYMQAIRIALTGRTVSPDLAGSIALLGRSETCDRIGRLLRQEGV